ncbi:MAG: tripartite tricarboxylate transporter TctB family protein [Deltaproteobacteria bacterium]|nr:tripartite tricarboxylate transporter TctB family protein [Deltaproteobacteria bacterium]
MKKTYLITHFVWMVSALAITAEAGRLGFGTFGRPGPGFLPFLAGTCLSVLAGVGLIQTVVQKPAAAAGGGFHAADILRIGLVSAVLFIYVFLWDIIGFPASTFLLLLFLFRCVEPLRWRTVFVAAGLTLAFTYILFSVLLGARLPAGRLWTYFIS